MFKKKSLKTFHSQTLYWGVASPCGHPHIPPDSKKPDHPETEWPGRHARLPAVVPDAIASSGIADGDLPENTAADQTAVVLPQVAELRTRMYMMMV